jgi:hypothetical protein
MKKYYSTKPSALRESNMAAASRKKHYFQNTIGKYSSLLMWQWDGKSNGYPTLASTGFPKELISTMFHVPRNHKLKMAVAKLEVLVSRLTVEIE